MKEISGNVEVFHGSTGEVKDLKIKERNLVKELFEKKNEASVQARLDKEIRQFEGIQQKKMTDYSMFIIKLQSIRDDLEYQRDKSEGDIGKLDKDISKLDKDISKVDKLIEKYKKEKYEVCIGRADESLDRAQKVLSL